MGLGSFCRHHGGRAGRTFCTLYSHPTRRGGEIRPPRVVASRSSCEFDHAHPGGPESKCRAKQCRGVHCMAAKAESSYFALCYLARVSAWCAVILPAISAVGGWRTLRFVRVRV